MINQLQYTFTSQPIDVSIDTSSKEDNMSKDEAIACHATVLFAPRPPLGGRGADAVFGRTSKRERLLLLTEYNPMLQHIDCQFVNMENGVI